MEILREMPSEETDFFIIGGGVAGVSAAIELHDQLSDPKNGLGPAKITIVSAFPVLKKSVPVLKRWESGVEETKEVKVVDVTKSEWEVLYPDVRLIVGKAFDLDIIEKVRKERRSLLRFWTCLIRSLVNARL